MPEPAHLVLLSKAAACVDAGPRRDKLWRLHAGNTLPHFESPRKTLNHWKKQAASNN
jgi:hypothetical protein